MKSWIRSTSLAVLVFGILLFATGCASDEPDSFSADVYAPLVSDTGESWITFNGDGSRMVFGRHEDGWSGHTLWESVEHETLWQEPSVMPFSGTYNDRGARFYPALNALLFSSDRPVAPDDTTADFNIWIVQFDGEAWTAPEPMSAINSPANDMHASITADGTIWFASDREGSVGRSDLYRASIGSRGYVVESAGEAFNTEFSESDVFVDPDKRYVIFSRTDDPQGLGGDDLFISYRRDGTWQPAEHLGPKVNTPEYEYGPWVSRDGGTLYFTSHRTGTADIYRILMSELTSE